MSRNDAQFSTTTRRETTNNNNDTEWRDEHGKPIAGGVAVAGTTGVVGAAGVAGGAGVETTRVEKVTKVTTVKQVPDETVAVNRHDTAYTAGVAGATGVRTGGAASSTTTDYSSSATAGRVGGSGAVGARGVVDHDHRDHTSGSGGASGQYSSTTTSTTANRNVSGPQGGRSHDYSPERRREVVSGSTTTNRAGNQYANQGTNQHDTDVRHRYTDDRSTVRQTPQGVYQPVEGRGQWNERVEDTHGWRAERLSEDQMLEGSGKPMMLDGVAGTRNTRIVQQQPYRQYQTTTTTTHQQIAGQDVNDLLKYLLLIPLALLVPLFFATLLGIPFLGSLIPFASLFPFLKHLGLKHKRHDVGHSRLHKGYQVQPSSLYEDTTAHREVYCVPIAWEHLLKTHKWYDVVLVANDNTQVYAHKVVLAARSPVLEREIDALIARGRKEERSNSEVDVCVSDAPCKLTLKNLDGKLLKLFVEFLYSGRVTDRSRIEDLFAVGQALEVVDLQDSAAEELMHNLDASTVGEALIMGHDYNHCGLRKAAKAYIHENWKTVHGNSYYKRAMNRRPSILSDDYINNDREDRQCQLVRH